MNFTEYKSFIAACHCPITYYARAHNGSPMMAEIRCVGSRFSARTDHVQYVGPYNVFSYQVFDEARFLAFIESLGLDEKRAKNVDFQFDKRTRMMSVCWTHRRGDNRLPSTWKRFTAWYLRWRI